MSRVNSRVLQFLPILLCCWHSNQCEAKTILSSRGAGRIVKQTFTASRHTTVPTSWDQKLNEWEASSNDALQTSGSSKDYQCNVALQHSGPVVTFSVGDGVLDSKGDFKSLLSTSGTVKLVNRINFCEGPADEKGIEGCSNIQQIILSTVDSSTRTNTLLAHEFGHYKGLQHKTDDYYAKHIMYVKGDSESRVITELECRCAFLLPSHRTADLTTCANKILHGWQPRFRPITAGVSDEFLVSLGTGAIPFLLDRLSKMPSGSNRSDLVIRIAYYPEPGIQDPRILNRFRALASEIWRTPKAGEQDRETLYQLLRALGHRGGDEGLFVLTSTNREALERISQAPVGIKVTADYLKQMDAFKGSLQGIALSSASAATEYLDTLRARNASASPKITGVIEEASRTHEVVRRHGVKNLRENYHKMWGTGP